MPRRLDSLTAARFVAALGVLLHHGLLDLTGGSAPAGRYGVDFFFILSGFVLTWSQRPEQSPGRFYFLRFARVWPLHALTFVGYALLVAGGPITTFFIGLFLVQAWVPDPSVYGAFNTPSWTLACEAFFYLLFPLLIGRLRQVSRRGCLAVVIGCWTAMALVPVVVHVVPPLWTSELWLTVILPASRLPQFLIGIAMAHLVRSEWRPSPWLVRLGWVWLACIPVAAWLTPGLASRLWIWQLLITPPSAILIAALAVRDLRGTTTPRWAVKLGEWSFALYLTHYLLLQWLVAAGFTGWSTLLWYLPLSVALAGLAHEFFERPVERWLRGLRRPLRVS